MMKSMTGYGRARRMVNRRDITVEIRAVNNRYLDCTVKLPRTYLFAEEALKKRVQEAASRGKIDVYVTVDASAADVTQVLLNEDLAKSYMLALRNLMEIDQYSQGFQGGSEWNSFEAARTVVRFPDVLIAARAEEDVESVRADLCAVLDEALENWNAMRLAEGRRLEEDLRRRLDAVEADTARIEARSPETAAEYREKLLRRMREALQGAAVDEQRLLTEAAIYADKVAVDEETVRLRSHAAQLRDMLDADAPQGRRMDFLIQEINREANTIGAKCGDVEIARLVVDLKAEVEKMREQAQNIE